MEREIPKLRTLSGQPMDMSAYQRHADSHDQALAQCRAQLTAQAQRIDEGEQHLRGPSTRNGRLDEPVNSSNGTEYSKSRSRVGRATIPIGGGNEGSATDDEAVQKG